MHDWVTYRAVDDGGDTQERAASSQGELDRGGESLETYGERAPRSVGYSGNPEGRLKRSRGPVGRRAGGAAPHQAGADDAANAILSTAVT